MKVIFATAMLALAAGPTAAQSFELEVTEQALNRLVARLGDSGNSGVHQPHTLSALGYGACSTLGTLDCTDTRNLPTAQPSAGRPNLRLAFCKGADGRGTIVPAPAPVTWQWWITEAHFTITAQQLQFSATVRYRIGTEWFSEQRNVPAALNLDVATQRLHMAVSSFTVPLRYTINGVAETITEVDVGRHTSFGIPISAQTFQVIDLEGRSRSLTSRVQSASVEYSPGTIRVRVYGGFN